MKGYCEFQFQIGAIGSKTLLDAWATNQGFNSRLVRLAVISLSSTPRSRFGFNSRLVRLADIHVNGATFGSPVSIPDWCDWQFVKVGFDVPPYKCFNSRLVRLAVRRSCRCSPIQNSFNSRLVRLAGYCTRKQSSD